MNRLTDRVIEVKGINELRRALKHVSADAPKEVREALKAAAEEVVAAVKTKVPTRTGRARRSVTVRPRPAGAAIAVGGRVAPWYPWLDFGGSTKVDGPGGRVKRDRVEGGRYLYPTLDEKRDEIIHKVERALADIARRNDIETRGGIG